MNIKVLTFGIILSLFSCTHSPTDTIIQPLETSAGDFSAKVTKSIPISIENEFLIDKITNLEFYSDRFYLFDRSQHSVLIINNDGSLLLKIPRGKGPGELKNPEGLSCSGDKLIIMDWPQVKIYSLTGSFIEAKNLPSGSFATRITILPNGNILTYGMSPDISQEIKADYLSNTFFYYHILDSTLTKEILPLVPLHMECGGMESVNSFSYYDDHYLLSETLGNHLLIFNGDTITGSYTVDFGKYTFREEELKTDKWSYTGQLGDGTRYGLIEDINETRNFISFSYFGKIFGVEKNIHQILYSKRSGKTADFSEVLQRSDIPELIPMNTVNDEFLCLFQPAEFTEDELTQFKKEGLIAKSITMESNPVIFFIKVN